VCTSEHFEPLTRVDGYDIVRCLGCGMGRLDPLPPESDVLAGYTLEYFEDGGGGYGDYLEDEDAHRKSARQRLEDLRRWLATGSVLDVGCAAGFFLDEARRAGFSTHGVEVCGEMAAAARERLQLAVETGQIEACPEPDGSLDAIAFYNVLAHLLDPLSALRRAHALLRPGGIVVVETWDLESPIARLLGSRWPGFTPPSLLYYFGRRTLPTLLERAGFSCLRSQHGSKPISLRHAASVLRHKYPGAIVGRIEQRLRGAKLAARLQVPFGFGQLLTIFGRRSDSA
jgi:SAM-dependent methyltransferase